MSAAQKAAAARAAVPEPPPPTEEEKEAKKRRREERERRRNAGGVTFAPDPDLVRERHFLMWDSVEEVSRGDRFGSDGERRPGAAGAAAAAAAAAAAGGGGAPTTLVPAGGVAFPPFAPRVLGGFRIDASTLAGAAQAAAGFAEASRREHEREKQLMREMALKTRRDAFKASGFSRKSAENATGEWRGPPPPAAPPPADLDGDRRRRTPSAFEAPVVRPPPSGTGRRSVPSSPRTALGCLLSFTGQETSKRAPTRRTENDEDSDENEKDETETETDEDC